MMRIKFKDHIEACSPVTHSAKSSIICAMTERNRYILYFKTPADAQKVYDQIFMNGCYDASEDDYDCDTIYNVSM